MITLPNIPGNKFLLLSILFLLSGIAGLIYQVVWFKHLSYFLGNTTYSQVVVLSTFMGGLAIGAWWWGKKADVSKNVLNLFAWLEIGIAVYCFLYMHIFEGVKDLFISIVKTQGWPSDSGIVLFLKFIVSILTMFIPTVLMGGTLPVLVRYLSNRISDIGKNVSMLYFINSLGAVFGTVLAGFYLIQTIGLTATVYFGAILDLFVGLYFLIGNQKNVFFTNTAIRNTNKNTTEIKEVAVSSSLRFRIILLISGLSGLCAMIYEVAWLRLLIPILNSSTYSFSLILIVFISGITIGSLIVYFGLHKIKDPFRFIGFCQLGIVLSMLLTIPFYEKIPYFIWKSLGSEINIQSTYFSYLSIQFIYIFLLIILPTIFMGMTLPVATKIAVKEMSKSGSVIGSIFALNTLGTVLGALIAGMAMIPFFGIQVTIEIAISINLFLFLIVFFSKNVSSQLLKIISIVVVILFYFNYKMKVNNEKWSQAIMTSEISRKINRFPPPISFEKFYRSQTKSKKILFYKEGVSGTVAVGKNDEQIFLYTNGKGDANSIADRKTQSMLAHIPMVLHPKNFDDIFIIGFGSGTTVGNALLHDEVKEVWVAEISSEVIQGSEYFNHMNGTPLMDNRTKVISDDGLSVLRLTDKKFDIIISQPSNPWSAGVGNLYTKEFFETCRTHLKSGGVLAQWFNTYELDDKNVKTIIQTVLSQFKGISFWQIGKSDILILCSEKELDIDLIMAEKRFEKIRDEIDKLGVSTFPVFLSQEFLSDRKKIVSFCENADVISENKPILEFSAPKAYYYNKTPDEFLKLDQREKLYNDPPSLLNQYFSNNRIFSLVEKANVSLFQSFAGNKFYADKLAEKNPYVYIAQAQAIRTSDKIDEAIALIQKAINITDTIPSINALYAELLFNDKKIDLAEQAINKAISLDSESDNYLFIRANIYSFKQEHQNSIQDLRKAIELNDSQNKYYLTLAGELCKTKEFYRALDVLSTIESTATDESAQIHFIKGTILSNLEDYQNAISEFNQAIMANSNMPSYYLERAKIYSLTGKNNLACIDLEKAISMGVKVPPEVVNKLCSEKNRQPF